MTTKTMQLGKSSLLSLAGNLEIKIVKVCGKRKTRVFCKKYEELVTSRFAVEHGCFRAKRIYMKEGDSRPTVILCPHLMTLKGEPFYKEHESIIYDSLEGIYEVRPEFKHKPEKLETSKQDVFSKTARNIDNIKRAFYELQREA